MGIGCLSLCSMALVGSGSVEEPAAVIADGAREHLDGLVAAMLRALPRPEIDQARALLADISALVPDAAINAERIGKLTARTHRFLDKEQIESYERSLCVAVLRELGSLGGPATLAELAKIRAAVEADQSDYQKWYWACKAMAAIDPVRHPFDRSAADILADVGGVKISNEDADGLWTTPLVALGQAAIDDLDWVVGFDSRENRRRRWVAINALGRIGGPRAAAALRNHLWRVTRLARERARRQEERDEALLSGFGRPTVRLFRDSAVHGMVLALMQADQRLATADEVFKLMAALGEDDGRYFFYDLGKLVPEKIPAAAALRLCERILLAPVGGPSGGGASSRPVRRNRLPTWSAARFLGKLGGPAAGELLSRALLEDPNDSARIPEAYLHALGKIKDYDAVPSLIEAAARPKMPASYLARALGERNDARAIPALEQVAGREQLKPYERFWIAAALARFGKDYHSNAKLVRDAAGEYLYGFLEAAPWVGDAQTVAILAELLNDGPYSSEALKALEAIGTYDALQTLDEAMALAGQLDVRRFAEIAAAAARIGTELGVGASEYEDAASVADILYDQLGVRQRGSRALSHLDKELLKKRAALARQLWIGVASYILDWQVEDAPGHLEYSLLFSPVAMSITEHFFGPELVPVLKRIAAENEARGQFRRRDGSVVFYYCIRSKAARILTEGTGQVHTFVDVDGRRRPGGWDPSKEEADGDVTND